MAHMRSPEVRSLPRTSVPVGRRSDQRLRRATEARRLVEGARGGRAWINGREVGGADPRFAHLAGVVRLTSLRQRICSGCSSLLDGGEHRAQLVDHVAVELDARPRRRTGVGPWVTSAIRPPPRARQARQRGHRVDLQRAADAEHQVGLGGQVVGLGHRGLGQQLAEEHDVGLERRDAGQALRRARTARPARPPGRCAPCRRTAGRRCARSSRAPRSAARVPAIRCSRSTFWVITPRISPRRSSSATASWAGLGCLSSSDTKRWL